MKAKLLGWDDKLPPLQADYWGKWLQSLFNINQVHIPRCYNNLNKDVVTYEVHIFNDVSELAYGAVAYLKLLFTDGTSTLSFLLEKSRLAPVKTVSLPRLELNAAVVGVRNAQVIKKEMSLPLSIFKYWTDSTLTLQYITDKSHRFKVYVANRVAEILEYTNIGDWQHIDGKMNPTDICTRGLMDPANLLQRDKHRKSWLLGPEFLTEEYQINNKVIGKIDEDDPEIKKKDILVAATFNKQPCLKYKRFSSYQRMIRVICWM